MILFRRYINCSIIIFFNVPCLTQSAIQLGYEPQIIEGMYAITINGKIGNIKPIATERFKATDTVLTLKKTPQKHKVKDQSKKIITPDRVKVTFNGVECKDDSATLESLGINPGTSVTLELI